MGLLVAVALSFAFICQIKFAYCADCDEGFQIKKDNFWYSCTKGKQVAVACISSDGDRIDEGTKYQTAQVEFSCDRDPKNAAVLKLVPVSCISNGQPVPLDTTFNDDSNGQLKCVKDGDSLKLSMIGCVGDDGKPLAAGGTVTRDGVVYDCKGGTQLAPKSCEFEGKQYAPGTDIISSSVWFTCEKLKSGDLAMNVKGCVDNGTKYKTGDKLRDYYFLYECQLVGGMALRVGVGCVERTVNNTVSDYIPGAKWLVGKADNRYQITCIREGLTIRRQGIACYYKTKDGEGLINGGCMRKVGFQILQCTPSTPRTPNVRIRVSENPTAAKWAELRASGLKEC